MASVDHVCESEYILQEPYGIWLNSTLVFAFASLRIGGFVDSSQLVAKRLGQPFAGQVCGPQMWQQLGGTL